MTSQGAAGSLLLGAGIWALAADIPVANVIWYVPAWYGYLLILNAVLAPRTGSSFFIERRRELVLMLFGSIPFWFFFEACNLRLRNWYYVFALRNPWASAGMAVLAFATVLPACLLHAEALEAMGGFRKAVCPKWSVTPGVLRAVGAGGLLCAAIPLILPRFTFPLIWLAPIGLEAVNFRSGAPSMLRDLEEGRCDRVLRLVAGGLWAGLVWELFNSLARCKWIYSVPGFESLKIFEMPVAGFLGFPVLALAAFAYFSFLQTFFAVGRSRLAVSLLALLFCAAVDAAVERQTVRSRRPLLEEISALDAASLKALKKAGIATPERLARAADREGLERLAQRVGITRVSLAPAVAEARLAIHKGMGVPRAQLLEAAGVQSVADLSLQEPPSLWQRVAALAAGLGVEAPRLTEVRVWTEAARRRPEEPSR